MKKYFVNRVLSWSGINTTDGKPVDMCNTTSTGFLVVYDSLEDLQKEHGDDAPYTVVTTEKP